MPIVDLKTQPMARWKPAILDIYPFLPYWWLRGVTPESRQALMSRELDAASRAEKTSLLGCTSREGDLLGFAQLRCLEWDTNHFGHSVWRLDHLGTWDCESPSSPTASDLVQGIIQTAHKQGWENIQARLPIDNLAAIQALEGGGFRTVEILTTWVFDLARSSIQPKRNPGLVRDFESADLESLLALARDAYDPIPNRFHLDPHFSAEVSSALYVEWLRNSCSGELADHIAVVKGSGQPVGYSTMKYFGDHEGQSNVQVARLGLAAVLPEFRNLGLATDAVLHHLEWLKRRQADFCLVGGHGNNVAPQRVWLKVGFAPATMDLSLHFWLNDQ